MTVPHRYHRTMRLVVWIDPRTPTSLVSDGSLWQPVRGDHYRRRQSAAA
jgi:hypothetical protein